MSVKTLTRAFNGGIQSPEMFGRVDLAKNQTGLAKAVNFVLLPHGPAQNRSGFEYVLEVKNSLKQTRAIPFEYSTTQTYALEVGEFYVRFHVNGGTLLEANKNITGITNANPGVVTSAAHGYNNGDTLFLASIGGTTALNGRWVKVAGATANTYQLTDLAGANIDTTAMGVYTAGGTCARVYEVVTPYAEADLFSLHYTQSADVLTITHPNYNPMELKRLGPTNWTLSSILFVPTISTPAQPTLTVSGSSGTTLNRYKMTAVSRDGLEESLPSPAAVSGGTTAISAITQANPAKVTANGHSRALNDPIYIAGVVGMTQVAGEYLVGSVVDANNITIKNLDGTAVDSTAYTAYTSGGTVQLAAIANDLTTAGNNNVITGAVIANAVRYNFYKFKSGLYGYIGQASVPSFTDNNIAPDMSKTPAEVDNPFSSAGNYPRSVGYFDQRRAFAGTTNKPQNFWATRSATEANLSFSIPTRDDDRIAFRIAARQANTIEHIVPLLDLMLLTSGGEWLIQTAGSDVLTNTSAKPRQISAEGANKVQPIVTGKAVLYAQARGGRVREMVYQTTTAGGNGIYVSNDISVNCPDRFDPYNIVDAAYTRAPHKIGWFVRSDGMMIATTYLPEQQVQAWHEHSTQNGTFESACAVQEGSEDALYAITKRTINGRTVRYFERMRTRRLTGQASAFFVDAGSTYNGAATLTITNAWHLEGQKISILADGAVHPQRTVTNGSFTLDNAASVINFGIPITADLQTLPLAIEAEAAGQGQKKSVNSVKLRVAESSGIFAGPAFDKLKEARIRTTEPYGSPPRLQSTIVPIIMPNLVDYEAQVCVRQADPLPLTVSAMILDVALGG